MSEPPPARLFVAAELPAEALDQLARLERAERPGVRWTRRDQWHVTLRFLGDVGEPAAVVEALSGVRAAPAEAVLGPRAARLGRGVLCVPVAGLEGVASGVVAATAGLGRPPDPRRFTGHVTLARLRHVGACGLAEGAVSAAWVAREVVLVRSHLGRGGASHAVLARIPLGWGRPAR
ncbi:MAG: hypothetical protein IPM45_04700 [Acidimicrobiales bacterium]|nr:hypothetical protein [Acidimicrobiales bacterium]